MTSNHSPSQSAAKDATAAAGPVDTTLPQLGRGFVWQDLAVGQRMRTFRRTVTETDLVNFISVTGMLEAIFIEEGYEGGAIQGRPVPAALTYSLIEGFILQTMIQGTGLARRVGALRMPLQIY